MSEFDKHHKRGLQTYCRACRKTINRHWYARHKERWREYRKRFQLRNKQRVLEYLRGHPCVDCGESEPALLEFDHQGRKRTDISEMIWHETSWKTIEEEISRCQVRCANCHRRKTAREQGWFRILTGKSQGPSGEISCARGGSKAISSSKEKSICKER